MRADRIWDKWSLSYCTTYYDTTTLTLQHSTLSPLTICRLLQNDYGDWYPSLSSMTRTNWKMSIEYLITHVEAESESSDLKCSIVCSSSFEESLRQLPRQRRQCIILLRTNRHPRSGLISSSNMTNYWSIMMGTITGSWVLALHERS